MEFRVVTGKAVHQIIHADAAGCARVVADAYLAHHRGESVNPNSYFLRFPSRPEARIIALPASLGAGYDVSGIKWIASYPFNIRQRIPRASAVLVLNRTDNGFPFACLEASIISAARTAASAALAAEALSGGRAARTLGIVGADYIARHVYGFLTRLGWEIERVLVHDLDPEEARRFQSSACDPARHREIALAPDAASLLRDSDLVLLTTSASVPHLDDPALLAHNPVVLHLSLRDLSPRMILAAHNVVDDIGHVMNANTSVHLVEQQRGDRSFVAGTLAEVLLGQVAVDRARPIVFSPFGLGVLDLAVGKWVFDQALEAGATISIDDFFFDLAR